MKLNKRKPVSQDLRFLISFANKIIKIIRVGKEIRRVKNAGQVRQA